MKVLKELAVAVASYEDRSSGQQKNRYKNIGVLMESTNDRGEVNTFLMLDRSFNPAGVPFKLGSDKILISLFDPKPRDETGGGRQQSNTSKVADQSQSPGGYGAGHDDLGGDDLPF